MKVFVIFITVLLSTIRLSSQEDKMSIYMQVNTVFVYSNYSLNLESFDFLKTKNKHSLKMTVGVGGWSTTAFNKNIGSILIYGLTYNFGAKNHLLDLSICSQNHFDTGLKDQGVVYIGSTLRPSIGYRYQPIGNHYFFRIGTGWREVFQLSFGWRF